VPGRAEAVAERLGVESVASPDHLFAAGIDGLVVAAATDAHAPLILAGVDAGIPTFCEKPVAADVDGTLAVLDKLAGSEVQVHIGFQRRFDAGYAEAHRLIQSGALGTLYNIRLAGHDPAPPPEAYIAQSGGLFRDFSVHDFDVLRFMTGREVEEVYADGAVRGFPVFEKYDDVDTAIVAMRLTDGPFTVLTVSRHDPLGYDVRAEVFGSKDSIAVGLGPQTPIRSVEPGVPPPAGPVWPDFLVRFESAYAAEFAAFVAFARGDIPSPCTAHDGVAALRIAEAATRSLHEHRPVPLAEIPG
jgi:myo-inositol 2-dehydrogenase/D-chiro-inositol 1-dehydrogenase